MMEFDPTYLAILMAWRKICRNIDDTQRNIKTLEGEKRCAEVELVRLQGSKASLEDHAAQHGWTLEPAKEARS